MEKSVNIWKKKKKTVTRIKLFCAYVIKTNGFTLNHNKSLQIYFFCVKCQTKNDFLKDVKAQ